MEADIISTWHPPTRPDLVVLSKNRMIFNLARRPNISNEMGCRAVLRNLKYHRLCDHLHYPRDGGWATWAELIQSHPNVCFRTNPSMTLGEVTNLGVGISLQPIGVKDREPNLTLLDVDGYAPAVTYWLS